MVCHPEASVGRRIPMALQTIRIQHCGIAAFSCASLAVNCVMKRMLSRLCIALLTTTAEAALRVGEGLMNLSMTIVCLALLSGDVSQAQATQSENLPVIPKFKNTNTNPAPLPVHLSFLPANGTFTRT